jgi:hypothetical protein
MKQYRLYAYKYLVLIKIKYINKQCNHLTVCFQLVFEYVMIVDEKLDMLIDFRLIFHSLLQLLLHDPICLH